MKNVIAKFRFESIKTWMSGDKKVGLFIEKIDSKKRAIKKLKLALG